MGPGLTYVKDWGPGFRRVWFSRAKPGYGMVGWVGAPINSSLEITNMDLVNWVESWDYLRVTAPGGITLTRESINRKGYTLHSFSHYFVYSLYRGFNWDGEPIQWHKITYVFSRKEVENWTDQDTFKYQLLHLFGSSN